MATHLTIYAEGISFPSPLELEEPPGPNQLSKLTPLGHSYHWRIGYYQDVIEEKSKLNFSKRLLITFLAALLVALFQSYTSGDDEATPVARPSVAISHSK